MKMRLTLSKRSLHVSLPLPFPIIDNPLKPTHRIGCALHIVSLFNTRCHPLVIGTLSSCFHDSVPLRTFIAICLSQRAPSGAIFISRFLCAFHSLYFFAFVNLRPARNNRQTGNIGILHWYSRYFLHPAVPCCFQVKAGTALAGGTASHKRGQLGSW